LRGAVSTQGCVWNLRLRALLAGMVRAAFRGRAALKILPTKRLRTLDGTAAPPAYFDQARGARDPALRWGWLFSLALVPTRQQCHPHLAYGRVRTMGSLPSLRASDVPMIALGRLKAAIALRCAEAWSLAMTPPEGALAQSLRNQTNVRRYGLILAPVWAQGRAKLGDLAEVIRPSKTGFMGDS
jgi:hypothetical protein